MSAPYVPFNPHLKQSRLRQIFEMAPRGFLNLGVGQPGEDTPAFIREAAARADEYVRDNPWTGVGIGAAVGVVLGVLLTRR